MSFNETIEDASYRTIYEPVSLCLDDEACVITKQTVPSHTTIFTILVQLFFLCSIATRIQPPAASRMAGVRFGNTQDVVVLFEGDSDEISEYIRGLIFIAAVTFVIFMVRRRIERMQYICTKQRSLLSHHGGQQTKPHTKVAVL